MRTAAASLSSSGPKTAFHAQLTTLPPNSQPTIEPTRVHAHSRRKLEQFRAGQPALPAACRRRSSRTQRCAAAQLRWLGVGCFGDPPNALRISGEEEGAAVKLQYNVAPALPGHVHN